MSRPIGIDPTKGVGTAYEGMVKVPRPGGIRKGWIEQFVVVCDFKIFLFDLSPGRGNQPSHSLNQVLDIRCVLPRFSPNITFMFNVFSLLFFLGIASFQ